MKKEGRARKHWKICRRRIYVGGEERLVVPYCLGRMAAHATTGAVFTECIRQMERVIGVAYARERSHLSSCLLSCFFQASPLLRAVSLYCFSIHPPFKPAVAKESSGVLAPCFPWFRRNNLFRHRRRMIRDDYPESFNPNS